MPIAKLRVLVRVIEKSSPYMHRPRGRYLQVATPNLAKKVFGRVMPSFEKPYKMEQDVLITSSDDVLRALQAMEDKYEFIPYKG